MAKTIGKDKVTMSRGSATDTETEPVGDRPNDEPRDEDMPEAVTDDALDVAAGEDEVAGDEIVVSSAAIAARRPVAGAVSRERFQAPQWMMANGVTRFIAESINELLKVSWPSASDAWQMTIVVIIVSAVVAAILGIADIGLIRALAWVVGLGQ